MNSIFNKDDELTFLNNLVIDYKDDTPYSQIKKNIIIDLVRKNVLDVEMKTALQLGCSNGYETDQLAKIFKKLCVIDGSSTFIEKLKPIYKNTNISLIHSLFEDMENALDNKKFDYIFCNYVLEHVYDSVEILKKAKNLLNKDGSIFLVVPNSNALSRQVAQQMGILQNLTDLTENDLKHGHRRVYTYSELEKDIRTAGLSIKEKKGLVFKILADFQLNKLLNTHILTENHIWALQELANKDENIAFSDSFFLEIY